MPSIKRNYLYNVVLELSNVLVPFLTVPYISRILGPEGIGIVAFRQSIVQYFVLFGSLGVSLYGNRAIAAVRDDLMQRNRLFSELVLFKISTCLIALCAFALFLLAARPAHLVIYLILGGNIASAALDISWFFMGLEDFRKTVSRSLFVKLLGVLMIFGFVKTHSDVPLYAFVGIATNLIGQALLWKYLPDSLVWVKPGVSGIVRHFPPVLKLFLPMVAIQVYVVLDTTMVGLFAGDEQVGIYSMSQKLVKTLLTIVTAMGVVMIPRMSYHFSRKDNEAAQQSALRSYRFASYASCLFLTPFLSVIPVFVPWFFGQAFEGAVTVIFLCSGVIFFIALNNVLGLQVLIPQNNEKAFSIAVIVGAFVNFFLNLILISLYKANGAALASSIAECVVWAVEMYLLKSFFDVYSVLKINLKDLLAMVLSVFCVYLIPFPEENPVFTIMIQGGFSVLFFMVLQFFNSSSIQKFLINNLLPWRSRDA